MAMIMQTLAAMRDRFHIPAGPYGKPPRRPFVMVDRETAVD
jgi:hypothetical protein